MATSIFRVITEDTTVCAGDEFVAHVLIDSPEASINAAQGVLIYDSSHITPLGVQYGSSFLRYWVTAPSMPDKDGEVPFIGGLPYPGFTGFNGNVMTIIFRAHAEGVSSEISLNDDVQALLNDGQGTPTQAQVRGTTLSILEGGAATCTTGPSEKILVDDATPPNPFEVVITRDSQIYNNDYFAVFDTTDVGTGVEHYEIRESSQYIASPWLVAKSPYRLQTQGGDVLVQVRAIDGVGNIRLASASAMLEPKPNIPVFSGYLLFGVAVVITLVLWARCRRKSE